LENVLAASNGKTLMTDNKKPRRSGKPTAERLLDAAEPLFAQRGFGGTSLHDIARAAGIREPGIYNHFAGKEALYSCVLLRVLTPLRELMDTALRETVDMTRYLALTEQIILLLAQKPQMAALFQQTLTQADVLATQLMEQGLYELLEKGRGLFAAVGREGIDDAEISLRLIALFNLCVGYVAAAPLYQRLTGESALSPSALQRQTRLVLHVTRIFTESGSRSD
jgi:AcrR family transcriptional regulator